MALVELVTLYCYRCEKKYEGNRVNGISPEDCPECQQKIVNKKIEKRRQKKKVAMEALKELTTEERIDKIESLLYDLMNKEE